MNYDLVSIIVPTYGRPTDVTAAIFSALDQTYNNIEVVVVDDNPPESKERKETQELIGSFKDSRIVYVKMSANSGGAIARNAGVDQSSGEFLCFLDDDDAFDRNKVKAQVSHLKERSLDVSLCNLNVKVIGGLGKGVRNIPVASSLREFVLYGNILNGMLMLRKELFLRVGGFLDVPRFQDHILMFELFSLDPKIGVLNEELYYTNIHFGERVSSSPKSREAYIIRHRYENMHKELLSMQEREFLSNRQRRSLLSCDLDREVSGLGQLLLVKEFFMSGAFSKSKAGDCLHVLRYFLAKSSFLKRLKYYLKSARYQ